MAQLRERGVADAAYRVKAARSDVHVARTALVWQHTVACGRQTEVARRRHMQKGDSIVVYDLLRLSPLTGDACNARPGPDEGLRLCQYRPGIRHIHARVESVSSCAAPSHLCNLVEYAWQLCLVHRFDGVHVVFQNAVAEGHTDV